MSTAKQPEITSGSSHALVSTELEREVKFASKDDRYRPDLRLCHCTGTAERVMSCLQGTATPTPTTGNSKVDAFAQELKVARVKCATDGLTRLAETGGRVEKEY